MMTDVMDSNKHKTKRIHLVSAYTFSIINKTKLVVFDNDI